MKFFKSGHRFEQTIYLLQVMLVINYGRSNKYIITNESMPQHETHSNGFVYHSSASAKYKGVFGYHNLPSNQMTNDIQFEIYQLAPDILEFKIFDANRKRYEVKDAIEDFYQTYDNSTDVVQGNDFNWTINRSPFSFEIARKDTNESIFNTTGFDLIFSETYLQLTTKIPTQHIFGYGERNQFDFQLPTGIYTLYNKDVLAEIENGQPPGHNVYGFHPMHLMKEKSQKYHVIYYETTVPLDVEIMEGKITYKSIGGILSFKIFLGDHTPFKAIKLYQDYIQGFTIPPFWSLGFHQSRWGYLDLKAVQNVYFQYLNRSIPFDVIWSDIDYMDDRQIFSVDEKRYNTIEFNEFLDRTHINYVPIVDPGIGIKKTNYALTEGMKYDAFLRSPATGQPLLGSVWPGPTVFTDFTHPNGSLYWQDMINYFYTQLHFSGLWLDMNEIANLGILLYNANNKFCKGECTGNVDQYKSNFNLSYSEDSKFRNVSYIQPPYTFAYIPGQTALDDKTLPMHAMHYNGLHELEMHNIFAFKQVQATYLAMQGKLNKTLPFILSRANSPGMGRYSAIWTGDNNADWEFLRMSIPALFNFNMFAIPMVGADICGFYGHTTIELCARWAQLATVYPFARNHNHESAIEQEFYNLGADLESTARKSLLLRYSILKYMYSLFMVNGQRGMVVQPLFFSFHNDEKLFDFKILNYQLMVGEALMAAPILNQTMETAGIYFPKGSWHDFLTGRLAQAAEDRPRIRIVHSPMFGTIPLFIRGGFIVPVQNTEYVLNTANLDNRFSLLAALSYDDADDNWRTFTLEKQRFFAEESYQTLLKKNGKEERLRLYSERITTFVLAQAHGHMMSIEKFDEQNVYAHCSSLQGTNCIMNIAMRLTQNYLQKQKELINTMYGPRWLNITFFPDQKTKEMQNNVVQGVKIYNLQQDVIEYFHQMNGPDQVLKCYSRFRYNQLPDQEISCWIVKQEHDYNWLVQFGQEVDLAINQMISIQVSPTIDNYSGKLTPLGMILTYALITVFYLLIRF